MKNENVEPKMITKRVALELEFREDFFPPENEDFVYNILGHLEKDPEACGLCPFNVWFDDYGYSECILCNAMADDGDTNTCPLRKFFVKKL